MSRDFYLPFCAPYLRRWRLFMRFKWQRCWLGLLLLRRHRRDAVYDILRAEWLLGCHGWGRKGNESGVHVLCQYPCYRGCVITTWGREAVHTRSMCVFIVNGVISSKMLSIQQLNTFFLECMYIKCPSNWHKQCNGRMVSPWTMQKKCLRCCGNHIKCQTFLLKNIDFQ